MFLATTNCAIYCNIEPCAISYSLKHCANSYSIDTLCYILQHSMLHCFTAWNSIIFYSIVCCLVVFVTLDILQKRQWPIGKSADFVQKSVGSNPGRVQPMSVLGIVMVLTSWCLQSWCLPHVSQWGSTIKS